MFVGPISNSILGRGGTREDNLDVSSRYPPPACWNDCWLHVWIYGKQFYAGCGNASVTGVNLALIPGWLYIINVLMS